MAALSFFETYKELFEYDKHVGAEDPVTLCQRDGPGAKTFLDKYRECEQRQAMEMRATVSIPLVSTLTVDSIMARTAPPVQMHYQHSSFHYPNTPSEMYANRSSGSGHKAVTNQHQHQHQQLYKQQQQQLCEQQQQPETHMRANTPVVSSFTRARLENDLRRSQNSSNQDDVATDGAYALQTPEQSSPQHHRVSPSKAAVSATANTFHQQGTHSPTRNGGVVAITRATALRSTAATYHPPKLADVLIDSSTRAATLRHRHLDEAKKIELLIGGNCGGRISAGVPTNLPPAIRRRLQASLRATQRREQLYAALRRDYETLCQQT